MIYTTPEIEIVLFDAADVIRTSAVSDVRGAVKIYAQNCLQTLLNEVSWQ